MLRKQFTSASSAVTTAPGLGVGVVTEQEAVATYREIRRPMEMSNE